MFLSSGTGVAAAAGDEDVEQAVAVVVDQADAASQRLEDRRRDRPFPRRCGR